MREQRGSDDVLAGDSVRSAVAAIAANGTQSRYARCVPVGDMASKQKAKIGIESDRPSRGWGME